MEVWLEPWRQPGETEDFDMTTGLKNNDLNRAEEDALRWHVRLHGGAATADDWMTFTRWLEEDPARNAMYDAVALAWDVAKESETAAVETAAPSADNIVAFPMRRLRQAVRARPLAFGGGFGAAIAATLLILMAPVFLNQNAVPGGIDYSTGIGQQRTITLADGSTVMLNTNTALTVTFGKTARRVQMDRGEAFFTVNHDSSRPFTVAANDVTITDVGTRFDVRKDPDRTLVSVTEGIVDITPVTVADPALGMTTHRLTVGKQAVRRTGGDIVVQTFNPEQVTAWQQGQLVFNNDDLGTVTAELNRYFEKPVTLAGTDIDTLRFSGVLRIDDQQRALHDLTAFLPIKVEDAGAYVLLRLDPQNSVQ